LRCAGGSKLALSHQRKRADDVSRSGCGIGARLFREEGEHAVRAQGPLANHFLGPFELPFFSSGSGSRPRLTRVNKAHRRGVPAERARGERLTSPAATASAARRKPTRTPTLRGDGTPSRNGRKRPSRLVLDFIRACQRGQIDQAELAARELPQPPSLPHALNLFTLYARAGSPKFEPAAVGCLAGWRLRDAI
jgi:hypothetical protein